MISYNKLIQLSNLPKELDNLDEYKINFIINEYSKYSSIEELDKYFESTTTNIQPYIDIIRPIAKCLFDLNTISDESNDSLDSPLQEFRPNQIMAIDRTVQQDFKSGIHCQIMGAGKSIIMLNLIQTHHQLYGLNKIYIICTERIDILKKLFFDDELNLNQSNKQSWKRNNIIDLDQFELIENIINKKFTIPTIGDRPIIWLINNAFIRNRSHYTKINRIDIALVLVDECHSISGIQNYNMLKWLKYGSNNDLIISIIGLSATPLRQAKNADKQLIDIYSIDKDLGLNIISNYTLIDALKDNIVLPFKHIIIEPKTATTTENFICMIFETYIKSNDELPYKKGVSWSRLISKIDTNYTIIDKVLTMPEFTIYKHHSKLKNKTDFDKFCKQDANALLLCVNCCKEGSDIENLDYAVYLDCVKKRSLLVSLQTAGRVMRPDKLSKKRYAYIIELIRMPEDESIEMIEIFTINKLINYYKTILNLSTMENTIDDGLITNILELYSNTQIIEEKSEIHIKLSPDTAPCIIKLDLKTIDWSILKQYLQQTINKITNTDDFTIIINKLVNIPEFNIENDYWKLYMELDHSILNIPPITEFKTLYRSIFETKTWYQILNLSFDYYDYTNIKHLFNTKYPHIDNLTEQIYHKLRLKHNRLPKYPLEYYRLFNINSYNDIIQN